MKTTTLKPEPDLAEPSYHCDLCPRLHAFIAQQRLSHPEWFNGPVSSFGDHNARLLITGLAPGLQGANRTGRPFTGDYAGELLYGTLREFNFATGTFAASIDDGVMLKDAIITNAVRCVPPQNKPIGAEIRQCNSFLRGRIAALPQLVAIVALGKIAHDAVIMAYGEKQSRYKFGHGAVHDLGPVKIFDSYHCSRYNTNTKRLTPAMFNAVFADIRSYLDSL